MAWYCKKCKEKMRTAVLGEYEHEKGLLLKNVDALVCPKCDDYFFTEAQMEKIEKRTRAMRVHLFAFTRKLTISGRSLVFNIPEDVVRHMKLRKGQKINLRPLDDAKLLLEIV